MPARETIKESELKALAERIARCRWADLSFQTWQEWQARGGKDAYMTDQIAFQTRILSDAFRGYIIYGE